jgi:hypothetical protein
MNHLDKLEREVAAWPGVTVGPHRFAGKEFCYGNAEIGHTHPGGIVDIPMPRAMHDALLEDNLAERHHWAPDSGWITYRVTNAPGLAHAIWLMRLSYLRYALKQSEEPQVLFERETQTLKLSPDSQHCSPTFYLVANKRRQDNDLTLPAVDNPLTIFGPRRPFASVSYRVWHPQQ